MGTLINKKGTEGVNKKSKGKGKQHDTERPEIPRAVSTTTLAQSIYSEKFEEMSRTLSEDGNSPGEKYPILKLNDNLHVAIGDSFEPSPSSRIEDASRFEYCCAKYPKLLRLLIILPHQHPDEPLETIMFHADLDEVPFQALSHTSEDKSLIHPMHVNGRRLNVSESLYRALCDIRNVADSTTFSIVWAEAICINQGDVVDRETHLRLARDIFTSAHVTLAHLGGTSEQQEKAFEAVDILYEACKYDEFRDRLEQDELDLSSLNHLSIDDKDLHIPQENRLELTRLYSHHWFERIWNWQEVGLSKKLCIMYGGAMRTWGTIADVAWCLYQLRWETSVSDNCLVPGMSRDDLKHYHILHLDEHRDGAIHGATFSLLSLLTESQHFTAASPLDRVYALYSHIGNSREQDIVQAFFDYQMPKLRLYLNIALNCMLSHRTLDALHLVHNQVEGEWPSFVADLSRKENVRILGSRNGRRTWEYQACGETALQLSVINHTGQTKEGIPFFNDEVRISVKGLQVDEIHAVGSEMKGPALGTTPFLADWVSTALTAEDDKFYIATDLRRPRDLSHNSEGGDSIEVGKTTDPSNIWMSRRTSLAGTSKVRSQSRTRGEPGSSESRSYLHNAFTPSLVNGLQKLDLEARGGRDGDGELELVGELPHGQGYPIGDISVVEAFWRTLIKNQDENHGKARSEFGKTHFEPWFSAMAGPVSRMLEALAHGQSEAGPRPEPLFNDLVHMSCNGTRMMRTKKGLIGTVPRSAAPGDLVCVLYGGQTPFILRRDVRGTGMYRLVGDAYVHGIMEGEALDMGLRETRFEVF